MKTVYKSQEGKNLIIDFYENVLKRWSDPCEQLQVPTSFGNTFVMSSGKKDGEPVVFLHGSTSNSAIWMGDAAEIGKTYKVYCIDLIGEPGKSDETRPKLACGNYAQWLTEVLNGLELDKPAIVGNSLGGWMALDFATAVPERVHKLVLLASGGISRLSRTFLFKAIGAMMSGKGAEKLSKLIMGNITLPKEVLAFSKLLNEYYKPRKLNAPVFSDEAIKKLTMPVLYIGGDKDVFFDSVQGAARLNTLLPHADTRVLKNTHHALVNQTEAIAAFLAKE